MPHRPYSHNDFAGSGAQTNAWSLTDFLRRGFQRECLVPATNLMAANHSPISVIGAFFAILEGTSPTGNVVQCHALIYVSDAVHALYLSMETLVALGILSHQFPTIGKYEVAPLLQSNCSQPPVDTPHIRAVYSGCASPNARKNEPCRCPQSSAVPPPPKQIPFPCIPENMKE